jgi:hypothetical protein
MTRENADSIAGVGIPPSGSADVANVPAAVQSSSGTVTVPLFNVVDGSDTTHELTIAEMCKVFGMEMPEESNELTREETSDCIEVSMTISECISPF